MSDGRRSQSHFTDHAANERTLLAWIRTGIALMAFGFAIARFGLFLRQIAQVERAAQIHGSGSGWFGVAMVVLGLAVNAAATVRYLRIRRDLIEKRAPTGSPALVVAIGVGSIIVAVTMAFMLSRTLGD